MSFHYTRLAHCDTCWLRAVLGDRREESHLLEDEDFADLVQEYGSREDARIPALDLMLADAAQRVDWTSGQESQKESSRLEQLKVLRSQLVAAGAKDPGKGDGLSRVRRLGRRVDLPQTGEPFPRAPYVPDDYLSRP